MLLENEYRPILERGMCRCSAHVCDIIRELIEWVVGGRKATLWSLCRRC